MDFWGLLTQALRIAYATLRTPWNFTCKKKFAYATLTQKLTQPYETQAICNLNVFATAYAKLTQSLTQAYERIEIYIFVHGFLRFAYAGLANHLRNLTNAMEFHMQKQVCLRNAYAKAYATLRNSSHLQF